METKKVNEKATVEIPNLHVTKKAEATLAVPQLNIAEKKTVEIKAGADDGTE